MYGILTTLSNCERWVLLFQKIVWPMPEAEGAWTGRMEDYHVFNSFSIVFPWYLLLQLVESQKTQLDLTAWSVHPKFEHTHFFCGRIFHRKYQFFGPAHVGKSPRLDRRTCFSVPKGVDLEAQRHWAHWAVPAVPCFGESRGRWS